VCRALGASIERLEDDRKDGRAPATVGYRVVSLEKKSEASA